MPDWAPLFNLLRDLDLEGSENSEVLVSSWGSAASAGGPSEADFGLVFGNLLKIFLNWSSERITNKDRTFPGKNTTTLLKPLHNDPSDLA